MTLLKNSDSKKAINHSWNLLICGPIEHGGLAQSSRVAGGLLRKSEFDCTNTITRNINRWGHLFKEIKLTTWTNQAHLIRDDIKRLNIDIQLLEDPGREASFCGDSRIRVMTATAESLRTARDLNSYTLRIRSDQSFNLKSMITSHERAEKLIKKKQKKVATTLPHISALCFWLDRPYSLCNYAHAGSTLDLLNFSEAQIKYRHASALAENGWPEGDTVRKHLYSLKKELHALGFPSSHCFPALPKSLVEGPEASDVRNAPKAILKLWEFALKHIYSIATEEAMASLRWKGEKYPEPSLFNNGMRFHESWRTIAKQGVQSVYDYCPDSFDRTSCITEPFDEEKWLLANQARKIEPSEFNQLYQ